MADLIKGKKIIRSMLSVSGIVVLSKLLGFIKQMVSANEFGATIKTDIISLAEGLVENMNYLLVHAFATAFIPIYLFAKNNGENDGKRFASNTIKVFFFITLMLSSLFFVASPIIARIIAPKYSGELLNSLSYYIKITSPVLLLIVEISVFNSLLKANEIFVPGELISFNQSVILIVLVLVFGKKLGPDALVVGLYCYSVFNLVFLIAYSHHHWSLKRSSVFSDPNINKLLRMMGPLLLGYSVVFVNQQVDKIIVSGYEAGTITAMSYASVLSNFITTFIGSICGVLFTFVAQNAADGKQKEAALLTTTSVVQMITLFLPISVLTVSNSSDIVQLVYGRGRFDNNAVTICSIALIGYAFMFVPFVIRELYSRFQYSYEDSKRPMINSTIAIVINIILSIVLSRIMGVLGVTFATSVSVAICGILNYYSSIKKNTYVKLKVTGSTVPRWIVGVIICIAISLLGRKVMYRTLVIIRLPIIVMVSLFFYGIITLPIIKPIFQSVKKHKDNVNL